MLRDISAKRPKLLYNFRRAARTSVEGGVMLRSFVFLLVCSLLMAACGVRDNDKPNDSSGPDLQLSPFEQLVGEWSGIYRAIESDKPFGDASEAVIKLSADGTFNLTLNGQENARVIGQWSEFQGRSLIMKIQGSSVPRIGSAGKLIEPIYEMQGINLRISDLKFELKLTRKADKPGETPNSTPPTGIFGSWSCSDSDGRQTLIKLSNDNSFSLSSTKEGERLFLASGRLSDEGSAGLRLTPSQTSDRLPDQSYFQLKFMAGSGELKLKSDTTNIDTRLGVCTR